MLVSTSFYTREGANDGKISVGFTDDIGSGVDTFTCAVRIVSPVGVELCTLAGTMETVPIGDAIDIRIPIPIDSAGNYMAGEYIIEVEYDDGVVSGNPTYVYDYRPLHSPNHLESDFVKMTVALDCDAETLKADDVTVYGDVEILTRALTITPPAVTGVSPSITTGDTLLEPVTYTNVTYTSQLLVHFNYNELEVDELFTVFSQGSARIYVETLVDCEVNLCSVTKCLYNKFKSLKAKATKVGGWAALNTVDVSNYNYAQALVTLAGNLQKCGLNNDVKACISEAKALLSCDCGCSDTTTPTPLSGVGAVDSSTDLSVEFSGAALLLKSSTGDDVTLPVVDDTHNGLMSAAYKGTVDDAIAAIGGLGTDITAIESVISTAGLVGTNGVNAVTTSGAVTLGPDYSFWRLTATSGNITIVLDSTQMVAGRRYIISAYPSATRSIIFATSGLTTWLTGNASASAVTIGALTEQKNYHIELFRIGTSVFVTILKDTIVVS